MRSLSRKKAGERVRRTPRPKRARGVRSRGTRRVGTARRRREGLDVPVRVLGTAATRSLRPTTPCSTSLFLSRAPPLPTGHLASPPRSSAPVVEACRASVPDVRAPPRGGPLSAAKHLPAARPLPRLTHSEVTRTEVCLFALAKSCSKSWRGSTCRFLKNPTAMGSVFRRRRRPSLALFRRTPLPSHLVTSSENMAETLNLRGTLKGCVSRPPRVVAPPARPRAGGIFLPRARKKTDPRGSETARRGPRDASRGVERARARLRGSPNASSRLLRRVVRGPHRAPPPR